MTRQAARGLVISAAILILVTGARLPATNASREVDGQPSIIAASWAWTLASPAGFGDCLPVGGCDNVRIRALAPYGGRLYAGTTNVATGAEIWQYNGFTWAQQVQGGLGDQQNTEIGSSAVYGGKLYAGTQQSESAGAEVWAYDGIAWTRALTGGFDQSTLPSDPKNIAATALTTFDNKLFIGTRYDYRGAEIWAYDGVTVTQVVSNGLVNAGNVAVFSLSSFAGNLYAGTLNRSGAEVWRSANGVQWTRVVTNGLAQWPMLPSQPWP